MKRFFPLFALALVVSVPALAQNSIEAPSGWKTQAKAGGATTFTPPDLRAGEKFSITVYASAPLKGKTPEAWLRGFAGPVGKSVGKLAQPLKITVRDAKIVAGSGAYFGPDGAPLGAIFFGVSLDGGLVHMTRTLYSLRPEGLLERYKASRREILDALTEPVRIEAEKSAVIVPEAIYDSMKRGGALVPGIYVGIQTMSGGYKSSELFHLYASGEWRQLRTDDSEMRVGEYDYDARSGKIDIGAGIDLTNRISVFGNKYCFYGRDAAGKPYIYAEDGGTITTLRYVGPNKRLAPRAENARLAKIRAEQERYKFVVAPGKGVKAAQIAAVWWDQTVNSDGMNVSTFSEAFLLLKDGTIRRGLPVAFDEMNVAQSRQKEPQEWGRWRRKAGKTQVSWRGKPWANLKGAPAVPGGAGTRLKARYGGSRSSYHGTGSSFAFWAVAFDPKGRFSKDSSSGSGSTFGVGDNQVVVQSGSNNGESYGGLVGGGVAVGSVRKKNPNGDREGTYSINGYTITLRYDNGTVERSPFFFTAPDRKMLWFEADILTLGLDD